MCSVIFGSNKGPIRIVWGCLPLFWVFVCFAKLLKVSLAAFSQRGGQRFDPAQPTKEDNVRDRPDSRSVDLRCLSCDFPEYSQFHWSVKVVGRG
jgi:hypothetical protein